MTEVPEKTEEHYKEVLTQYVVRLAAIAHDAHVALYGDKSLDNVAVPIVADTLLDISVTGLLAYLDGLNSVNEKESKLDVENPPKRFDAVTVFMEMLMGRLIDTGHVQGISEQFDPEAYAKMEEARAAAQRCPDNVTKQ